MNIKEKLIKKIDEIITNGISSYDRFAYLPGFHIQRKEHKENIYFIFTSSIDKTDISKEQFLEEYKNILFDDNSEKKVTISGSIKDKTIVSFLLKEKPDDTLMKNIIDTFLDNTYKNDFQDIFRWCAQRPDKSYSQKIVFYILENFKDKPVPSFHKNFEHSISLLSCFNYKTKDYPLIHNFLTYSKDEILRYKYNENFLIDFLKKTVIPKDWEQFSHYVNGKIGAIKSDESLIEEKELPVLNIVVSHAAIKNKYSNVSYDEDINNMLEAILTQINKNKENLNLSKCFSSGTFEDNQRSSYLHFIGNKSQPTDNEKIKILFSYMIDLYAQAFSGKNSITNEIMEKNFLFSNISASTENQVKEEKSLKRKI